MSVSVSVCRRSDPSQWARIVVSPRLRDPNDPVITYADDFEICVVALDGAAHSFEMRRWISGVLSGLGYFIRRSMISGILAHRMTGRLDNDGIGAFAFATAVAASRLTGVPSPEPDEWEVVPE